MGSCLLVAVVAIGWVDHWVSDTTRKQTYTSIDSIPANKVGLLLGTSKYIRKGVINPYYQYRIDAAVALYKSGKILYILISGDNETAYYNEPATMKRDLIARGVQESCIVLDYAGLRTLDSILRCRDIFGEDHITIISQPFHNERALFIANHKGVTAIAYNAQDVAKEDGLKVQVREKLARVKMLFDLVLNKQPKYHHGDKIEIN